MASTADTDYRVSKFWVTVVISILIQTLTACWWASSITTEQRYLVAAVKDLRIKIDDGMDDRYRAKDAEKDFGIRDIRIGRIDQKIEDLEDRVNSYAESTKTGQGGSL